MTNLKEKAGINVGIDVGKFQLDIFIHEKDRHFTVSNTPDGIREALKIICRFKVLRIVMEATGRYETDIATAAFEKQLPVCIINPIQIRQFARASNQLAKTDKLDSQVIAEFGARMQPEPTLFKSKNLQLIKDLISRRRQLIAMRTQELNRIKIMGAKIERSCKRTIQFLDKEIEWTEKHLAQAVEQQDEWAHRKDILTSMPGVGNTVVYTLLADLPELEVDVGEQCRIPGVGHRLELCFDFGEHGTVYEIKSSPRIRGKCASRIRAKTADACLVTPGRLTYPASIRDECAEKSQ